MPAGLFHENYRSDERIFQTWFVKAWLIAFLIACAIFPLVASKYMVSILTEAGIAIIACHGLNVLTGFTGQISLGHAAFLGVGAYTGTILTGQAGVPFIVALPLSGVMAALVGMIFGIPSLRLRGLYLAIAASFTSKFENPAKTPFSFFVSPSYGTMGRIAIKWIRDSWKDTSRNPKLCFLYPDNKYGRDILNVCKDYAKKIGVDVGPDQVINWPTKDATPQLMNMKRYNPDYAYITSTAMNGVVILKNAKALGIKTKFISNIRNFEETLIKLSGGAANGTYGVHPIAPYGAEVPGMKKVVESNEKWHKGEMGTNVYVEGWVNILAVSNALRMADKAGKLTPVGIREAFEQFKGFDTGGLAPPLTFTKTDHRASMAAKIYEVKNDKIEAVTSWIELPRDKAYFGK